MDNSKNIRKIDKKKSIVRKKDRCRSGDCRCHRCSISDIVAKHIDFIKMYYCDECRLFICEKCFEQVNGRRRTEVHTKHRDRVREIAI